jgi:hypothetical protein
MLVAQAIHGDNFAASGLEISYCTSKTLQLKYSIDECDGLGIQQLPHIPKLLLTITINTEHQLIYFTDFLYAIPSLA